MVVALFQVLYWDIIQGGNYMFNAILDMLFDILDYFYNLAPVGAFFDMFEDITTYLLTYTNLTEEIFKGIYFIAGTNLVLLMIDFFILFVAFKVVFAIVNMASQFIP